MGRLYDAARSGDSTALLAALRDDMAAKLDGGVAGRDYAAIVKSLISVTEKLDDRAASETARKAKDKKRNRIADAQKRLKVVS